MVRGNSRLSVGGGLSGEGRQNKVLTELPFVVIRYLQEFC